MEDSKDTNENAAAPEQQAAEEVEDAQHHLDQVFGDQAQLDQQQIEDPQLEELQLINKAHTFFAEHISAGQVKTGAFQTPKGLLDWCRY